MIFPSPVQHYTRVVQHFAATRGLEVLALQASPILGAVLGGLSFERSGLIRLGLLLLGSLALTAHVFVFNDWAGHASDVRDPRRASFVFARRRINSRQVARVAIALLIFANVAFAAVGSSAMPLGAGIAALSLLYSCSSSFGKSTPFVASINHLLGGALHFLLGYTLCHALDARGLAISLFFGLVFAGGHLNQEVRDYEGDCLNGIRTSAVVFGCRRTFLASLVIFTAAYATLAGLAEVGVLPRLLLWTTIVWPLHVAWSLRALKHGLGFETALWMQRRYRLLFAGIGLAMLVNEKYALYTAKSALSLVFALVTGNAHLH
ncbi:MAG TPA: UbiA family prenyltransferase [Pyrinomonadaceae bacterium]|nr:UbiA family prenyltransferase [Pyrinomonadaceae bacterium]